MSEDVRVPAFPSPMNDYTTADGEDPTAVNTIRIGSPLSANQWTAMANNVNWLLGHGGVVAWWVNPGAALTPTQTITLRAYAWPRSTAANRMWAFQIGWTGADSCIVTFGFASALGGELDVTLTGSDTTNTIGRAKTFTYVEAATPTTGGEQISLVITHHTDSPATNITVMSGGLYEMPRAQLTTTTGVVNDYCGRGKPIYEATGSNVSVDGVAEFTRAARNTASAPRRQSIFHWYDTVGVTVTTTAYTNMFLLDPAAQVRLLENGSNSRSVQWTVYAKVTGASPVGHVRITSGIYGSSVITVTTTATVWATSAAISVETDDLSQTANVRGGIGSRSNLTFEVKRQAGTSVTVYGIAVGEEET